MLYVTFRSRKLCKITCRSKYKNKVNREKEQRDENYCACNNVPSRQYGEYVLWKILGLVLFYLKHSWTPFRIFMFILHECLERVRSTYYFLFKTTCKKPRFTHVCACEALFIWIQVFKIIFAAFFIIHHISVKNCKCVLQTTWFNNFLLLISIINAICWE